MQLTARKIAELVGGELEGDPTALVCRPGKIEEGGADALTFLANPRYASFVYEVPSAVVLLPRGFQPARPLAARATVRVDDVYAAVAQVLEHFRPGLEVPEGCSPKASIHPEAELAADVRIGDFAVVEAGARIEAGVVLYPQVYVGRNVRIGAGSILYPGVRIYHDCQIGERCILHANVVVGGDGFGFAPLPDGSYRKIPQLGNVIIEDEVEIGANSTIDRATLGATRIRTGAKIDNLVMVAHNVDIGAHTVVAAQAGFAGSTRIGAHCRIGGQAGFVGHIHVADGTQVQAQSGVAAPIERPGTAVYGSPALPYRLYLKAYALFKKLPEVYAQLRGMERRLQELENKREGA
ncbi:MAG: UDP-3-O-(3-hydroxymyristoyl)glucosamine N-acyltransferase [Bacteroidetes bacterium]|nr:MAG: UDP-3-O-(3-hydroxymyristoyl)glucosamine N-acyltransferase [Bacteroidota bacterium]